MKLHEDAKIFRQSIQATAQRLKIKEIYVEKDYWVCYALKAIFSSKVGTETVFKGGTALSKCFDLVERFSEDIDLVVMRSEEENDNQLKKKIRTISKTVEALLPEVNADDITQKMGMNRKTAHKYPQVFKGDFGQVRDVVVVEATWLGYYEPYLVKELNSYIHDMMLEVGQSEMITKYGLEPFEVKVLSPIRTICEKVMSLVRFSYDNKSIDVLGKKIRHLYDLTKMLKDKELAGFVDSKDFDEMLVKVGVDDVASYRNDNSWLEYHPVEALVFSDLENVWRELSKVYTEEFKHLVFGVLPSESEVLESMKKLKDRMATIDWTPVSEKITKL